SSEQPRRDSVCVGPVMHVSVNPAFKQVKLASAALLAESSIQVAHELAGFQLPRFPQRFANFIPLLDGPFLDFAVYGAREQANLSATNAVRVNCILEKPAQVFCELRFGFGEQLLLDRLNQVRRGHLPQNPLWLDLTADRVVSDQP